MTIQSLSYQDISASKRQASANKALQRLREQINTTAPNSDQLADYKAQMVRIEKWAAGTLEKGE